MGSIVKRLFADPVVRLLGRLPPEAAEVEIEASVESQLRHGNRPLVKSVKEAVTVYILDLGKLTNQSCA